MFRKTVWRKTVSDAINWHQDQALNTTIFILKDFGPTGFLLKENEGVKNFKVCLGDPHTCSCPAFQKEKELCKHICWILMRKFRLPRDHDYCFQLGLVERQILELLQGLHRVTTPRPKVQLPPEPQDLAKEDGSLWQKDIGEDDVCPICQEELLSKRLPVAHCRFGCGNNIHISCMKVWADHQNRSDSDTTVKCPLCREDFGPMKLLLEQVRNANKLQTSSEREPLNKHLGVLCNNCRILPIIGKCYRCSSCRFYHLCEDCMKRGFHLKHVNHVFGIRLAVLTALPLVRVRQGSRLLEAGMQCRICLRGFQLGQQVRRLPCHHKFHKDCVDVWVRQSNCCPLDWHVIYNPLTWGVSVSTLTLPVSAAMRGKLPDDQCKDLFIPGVGLKERTTDLMPVTLVDSSVCPSAPWPHPTVRPSPSFQDLTIFSVRIDQPRPHAPRTGLSVKRSGFRAAHPIVLQQRDPRLAAAAAVLEPQSGDTHAGLYVGVSPLGSVLHSPGNAVPRRIRPLRKVRSVGPSGSGSGQVRELTLRMTGVYISSPNPQKN
ncbi:E3 ubiquitin-protein ligase ZSWIM2 [Clupea harengus]|uniref:E3 ubiquitin-protein ligase ZSWIM2 n=1 Tax=Clupea harengus TaxID=7950 RepID=A0A6P8ERQ6_CLUHA|nr:E3 ubiquitin-protein ligase ZSWIM2 [Clupea harengus]